ncbi:YybS family protein [Brevibacillus massiliensis]|jgi:uncharacterized protein YybS (DUF2232 family)|uniref:YybS family protein n=1 Tax=Brevibacillus massiliensis TaxID=1118054 RepID=UPI0002F4CBD9|nr:DUF2232 domain-containing protein [Brevibacillus massiliensis]
MPNRTKQVAESALLLGISTVLLFLGTYTFFGELVLMAIPVSFILLAVQRSGRDMLVVIVVYATLGLLIAGIFGMLVGVGLALVGTVMGMMYKGRSSALPAVFGGAGVLFGLILVSLAVATFFMGINIGAEYDRLAQTVTKGTLNLSQRLGISEELIEQQISLSFVLLPSFLVVFSLFFSGVNHWLASIVAKRTGHPIPVLKPLREWSFPRSFLIYYFISLLLILIFQSSLMQGYWGSAILNVRYILDIAFIIQGLGLCLYVIHAKRWKYLTPVLIVSLFIFPPITNILSLLGIFDLGIGLRKRLETRM